MRGRVAEWQQRIAASFHISRSAAFWSKSEAAASPAGFWMARTGATSCPMLSIHRQRELKRGTEGYVWSDPQPATVGFDDRTAD